MAAAMRHCRRQEPGGSRGVPRGVPRVPGQGVFPHHRGTELCKHQDSRQPGSGAAFIIFTSGVQMCSMFSHTLLFHVVSFFFRCTGHGELQRLVREDGGPNRAALTKDAVGPSQLPSHGDRPRIWCSTASTTGCPTNLDFRCGRKAGEGMVNLWRMQVHYIYIYTHMSLNHDQSQVDTCIYIIFIIIVVFMITYIRDNR